MAQKGEEALDMTLDDVIAKKKGGGKGKKGKGGKGRGSQSQPEKPQKQAPKAGEPVAEKKSGAAEKNGSGDVTEKKLDMSLDDVITQEGPKTTKGKGKTKGKGQERSEKGAAKGGKESSKGKKGKSSVGLEGWKGSKGKSKSLGKGGKTKKRERDWEEEEEYEYEEPPASWRKGGKKGSSKGKKGGRKSRDWDYDDFEDEEEEDWEPPRRTGGKKGGGKGKSSGKRSRDYDYDDWEEEDDEEEDDYSWRKGSRKGGGKARKGGKSSRDWDYDYEDDDDYGWERDTKGKGGSSGRKAAWFEDDRDAGRGDRDGRGGVRKAPQWEEAPLREAAKDRRAGPTGGGIGRGAGAGWAAPKRGRADDQDGPPAKRSSGGSKRVKVTNIPKDLDWRDIQDAFEAETGEILRCKMDKDGTAWIDYKYAKDAVKAVETFDLGELNNRTIGVKIIEE